MNGFPKVFSDTYIGKALNKLLCQPLSCISTVPKDIVYFPIEFTGKNSFRLRKEIQKLMSEFYPQICCRVIFKSTNTISRLFKFKDSIPSDLQSSVIYKFTCGSCSASYIGKTKRHLKTRISEHKGRSARTGMLISNPPFSAIRDHSHQKDHQFSASDFKILASSNCDTELCIIESLYQYSQRPSLCNNATSTQLLCF